VTRAVGRTADTNSVPSLRWHRRSRPSINSKYCYRNSARAVSCPSVGR